MALYTCMPAMQKQGQEEIQGSNDQPIYPDQQTPASVRDAVSNGKVEKQMRKRLKSTSGFWL